MKWDAGAVFSIDWAYHRLDGSQMCVTREAAELAVEQARREGVKEGHQKYIDTFVNPDYVEHIRSDERERIKKAYYEARADHLPKEAFEIAVGMRTAQEPKRLEHLIYDNFTPDQMQDVIRAINVLIAAENERRGKPG